MTRVKVCGLTREADVDAVVDAGADAVGVVSQVPVDTPRAVDPERARDLLERVPPFVTSVLVTMPDSVQAAVRLVERVEPDAVQVHGTLAPEAVAALGRRTSVAVVATVDAENPDAIDDYAAVADAVLVDSVDADGGGGTGETHDWEHTREATADCAVPVVLAGGLTPDNVAAAVRTVRPFAVDVASGVEAAGGVKDHDAVRAFVRAATTASEETDAVDEGVTA